MATVTLLAGAAQVVAQQSVCATDPHDSHCGLQSTLHLLRVTAVVLAVVLTAIVLAAVAVYRKNKKARLMPNE